MKIDITSVIFFLGTHKPSLILRIKDIPQKRSILRNTWPIIIKTVQVIKIMENPRNCLSQQVPKER